MKVVILAGGLGTRLAEETELRPKPMIEIGARPILWHILKGYSAQGFNEFFVGAGYKADLIKRYFLDYHSLEGGVTVELRTGAARYHEKETDDWIVHIVDTGLATNTGGRLKRLQPWLEGGRFMLTYGDGLSDLDLHALLAFHEKLGRIATVTAVRPPARFGGLVFDGDGLVSEFSEKSQVGEGWINGGFMVFEPAVFEYLEGDETSLEADCLERLAGAGQLAAYRHDGFWQCMDTLRDLRLVERLWREGEAPWARWRV